MPESSDEEWLPARGRARGRAGQPGAARQSAHEAVGPEADAQSRIARAQARADRAIAEIQERFEQDVDYLQQQADAAEYGAMVRIQEAEELDAAAAQRVDALNPAPPPYPDAGADPPPAYSSQTPAQREGLIQQQQLHNAERRLNQQAVQIAALERHLAERNAQLDDAHRLRSDRDTAHTASDSEKSSPQSIAEQGEGLPHTVSEQHPVRLHPVSSRDSPNYESNVVDSRTGVDGGAATEGRISSTASTDSQQYHQLDWDDLRQAQQAELQGGSGLGAETDSAPNSQGLGPAREPGSPVGRGPIRRLSQSYGSPERERRASHILETDTGHADPASQDHSSAIERAFQASLAHWQHSRQPDWDDLHELRRAAQRSVLGSLAETDSAPESQSPGPATRPDTSERPLSQAYSSPERGSPASPIPEMNIEGREQDQSLAEEEAYQALLENWPHNRQPDWRDVEQYLEDQQGLQAGTDPLASADPPHTELGQSQDSQASDLERDSYPTQQNRNKRARSEDSGDSEQGPAQRPRLDQRDRSRSLGRG